MMEQILWTNHLTKNYGQLSAVKNLSFSIRKGEIYGLVGKNGAGKTTLLKMICGLTFPTSGEISLFGKTSGRELTHARSRIGCLIESPDFFPYLSAAENLKYYQIQKGIAGNMCTQEVLQAVGLENTGRKKYRDFSMGMKQRLGYALAIMTPSDILVLDEPVNGLDPMGIANFRDMICKLNREKSVTILISSHILGELSQIATVYGFLDRGMLVEQLSAKELTEKCKRRLAVKVDDPARAAAILENELGCKEFELAADGRIFIGRHMVSPEAVNKTLVKNGIKVSELTTTGLNLEQYFIRLVEGDRNA